MTRPTIMRLDANALKHNINMVRSNAGDAAIVAMVKANAYGHGIEWVTRVLEDQVDNFGVANLEEAILIKNAGIKTPSVLMQGVLNLEELQQAHELGCSIVLHQLEQLDLLRTFTFKKPQEIWVKINTGMNRLGLHPQQFAYVYEELEKIPQVVKPIVAMTHFSQADEVLSPMTQRQIELFREATQEKNLRVSMANSAGIINWPESIGDLVRPGIMMYGASPVEKIMGRHHGLQPVMSMHSELISVRTCQRGDKVGYGGTFVCPEAMPVGVVAIGYGDGYPRHAPNGTPVLVNGQRVPLIGRVSMDMITVDLRTQPFSKKGDPVLLWGLGLPAEEIANASDTIAYELFCQVTPRVPRFYL